MIERINLIPDETRKKIRAGRKRPLVASLLIVYVLALGAFYFYQKSEIGGRLADIDNAKKQRDELIAQSVRYKEVIERVNLTQRREEDIKKRLEVIGSLLEGRIYWSEALRDITHLVPDGIWFESLSTYDMAKGGGNIQVESTAGQPSNVSTGGKSAFGGKGVKFNGTALSNSRIAEFVFALENSRFFGNVLLAYSQKRELHGRDLYDFEITADLKTAGRQPER